jgi:hypothetical protein
VAGLTAATLQIFSFRLPHSCKCTFMRRLMSFIVVGLCILLVLDQFSLHGRYSRPFWESLEGARAEFNYQIQLMLRKLR